MSGKRVGITAGLLLIVAAGWAAWFFLRTTPVSSHADGGPRAVSVDTGPVELSAAEISRALDETYRVFLGVTAQDANNSDESRSRSAQQAERLFKSLETAAKEIRRDTFDIAAVVESAGRDPVKLFEWVRNETHFVPYRGLLRGPTGVLMDRHGNSLDRALLLYSLLTSIGHTARLARGELTDDQALALLQSTQPRPDDTLSSPSRSSDDGLRDYAQERGVEPAAMEHLVAKVAMQQQILEEAIRTRVTQQAAGLSAAVTPLRSSQDDDVRRRTQAVRDHWWVEWRNETSWLPMDPTRTMGAALTDASARVSPAQLRELGDLTHRIQLRVVIETWNEGLVREVTILERDLLPAELVGKNITLRFIPTAWPRDPNLLQVRDAGAKLKEVVLTQKEWLPVLRIDGQDISKYSFTDSGDVVDATLPPLGQGAAGLGRSIGGLLGGAGEKKERTRGGSPGHVTAAWIEYHVDAPSEPARTIRRQIVDVLGPHARAASPVPAPAMDESGRLERGLALMGETDILLLVSELSPEFASHQLASHVLANRQIFLDIIGRNPEAISSGAGPAGGARVPAELYTLALARKQWSRFGPSVYLDRPNVLSYHRRLRSDPSGKMVVLSAFDIVSNDVAVKPRPGLDPFLVRVEQGVLDTNAEAVLARACAEAATNAGCGFGQSSAEALSIETGSGGSWITIRNVRDPSWRTIDLPPDIRKRIEMDLESGHAVLVPAGPTARTSRPVAAWWRVDPRTGHVLGIGDRGWGQSSTEQILVTSFATTSICVLASTIDWGRISFDGVPYPTGYQMARCALLGAASGVGVAVHLGVMGKTVGLAIGAILGAVDRGVSMNSTARR